MSKLTIISIVGHNGVGKDTIASTLSLLSNFFRIGLADGIRASLNDLDGITWQFRKENDGAGPIARNSMKLMGSEAKNDIGCPLLWTDLVLAKIQYAYLYHAVSRNRFVIPDVRFPHEVARISSWASEQDAIYETWLMTRPGFGSTSHHESEISIENITQIDYVFQNSRDKQYLIDQVIQKIKEMKDEYKLDF